MRKKYLILSIYKPKFLLYSKLSIYRAYNRWALPVCFIIFLYEYIFLVYVFLILIFVTVGLKLNSNYLV
jgi:hypothetical protein